MSNSFKQHFVQRRLLSNFTSSPHNKYKKQKIWLYDKKKKVSKETNIGNVALKTNFLHKDADDIITLIERESYHIIERISEHNCVLCKSFNDDETEENHILLYRYLITQLYRTPNQRQLLRELPYWKNKKERELKDWQSSYFTDNSLTFLDFSFARNENQIKGHMAQIYWNSLRKLSKIAPIRIDGVVSSVFDVTMPIVVLNKTKIPYMINDIGLVPFFPLSHKGENLELITGEDTLLISLVAFPIKPNICINLCTNKSISEWVDKIQENTDRGLILETKKTQSIKLTNNLAFESANRFIYSNQPLDPTLLK